MPWATVDPKMKMEYSGPEEGVGSRSSWISEGQMGTGSVTITEVLPYRSVKSKIEYKKPFEAVQLAEMAIETANGASLVTWSVTGESTFVQKLVSTFLDMEQMIGDNFVQGLTKLKMITENTNK